MERLKKHRWASFLFVLGTALGPPQAWAAETWKHVFKVQRGDGTEERLVVDLDRAGIGHLLTTDGVQVQRFSLDNALRIAAVFQDKGLADEPAFAKAILGLVGSGNRVPGGKLPEETSTSPICLTLRMPDGRSVHVDSAGHPRDAGPNTPPARERYLLDPGSGGRVVQWPVEHAMLIRKTLLDAGYSMRDVLQVWLGLSWSTGREPGGQGSPEVLPMLKEVDPPCGQCQNGIWNEPSQACVQSGSTYNCTVCTVCG
jgi:hypothetical protein